MNTYERVYQNEYLGKDVSKEKKTSFTRLSPLIGVPYIQIQIYSQKGV